MKFVDMLHHAGNDPTNKFSFTAQAKSVLTAFANQEPQLQVDVNSEELIQAIVSLLKALQKNPTCMEEQHPKYAIAVPAKPNPMKVAFTEKKEVVPCCPSCGAKTFWQLPFCPYCHTQVPNSEAARLAVEQAFGKEGTQITAGAVNGVHNKEEVVFSKDGVSVTQHEIDQAMHNIKNYIPSK